MIGRPLLGAGLPAWLDYLEQLDPNRIELGLERTRSVLETLDLARPPFRVFSIGGTNGKGSVAAYLAALLRALGPGPVGLYTSPHLLDYRERIVVGESPVEAAALVSAFETVERARGATPLTYFEFGTIAALEVFRRAGVREAVLEVGLGGRLDAVNALDSAAAAVVSVSLDHQQWLGNDRDSIGREKAGIFRADRAAIIGDRDPPRGLIETAQATGADVWLIGRDFDVETATDGWTYRGREQVLGPLPEPGIPGAHQRDNAAVALALLEVVEPHALEQVQPLGVALAAVRLGGRLECRYDEQGLEWVLDVAHNPAAAATLAEWLKHAPKRPTRAVFGMLGDKDAGAVAAVMSPCIDAWYLAGLTGHRGQSAAELAARTTEAIFKPILWDNIAEAIAAAARDARPGERIVVFGSFHTLAQAFASGLVPQSSTGSQESSCESA
ncbi:MAG: bifunctional tetrahydrofolate synthase/dihydrofolate synthase [Gammaproteobacteria bacterium]